MDRKGRKNCNDSILFLKSQLQAANLAIKLILVGMENTHLQNRRGNFSVCRMLPGVYFVTKRWEFWRVFSWVEIVALCTSTRSFLLQPNEKSLLHFTCDTSLSFLLVFSGVLFLNDIFLKFWYALFIRTTVAAALKLPWITSFLISPVFMPFCQYHCWCCLQTVLFPINSIHFT